jgi:hypothetical protein
VRETTSVQGDVVLLTVVVGVLLLIGLVVSAAGRRRAAGRPVLPLEDQAPQGLGRLVPVGPQLDDEIRRGLDALEMWLAGHRRRT